MPKISAVMALYNTPIDLLEATVKSILNQTLVDFELIVVDDASTVEYGNFFVQFNDERIKYHKLEKNAGPGHARNEGIKLAQGEYVAITDSDDVYMSKRFELQSGFLDKNPEISLLGGAFRASNKKRPSFAVEKDEDIKLVLLFNSAFANPLVMFRREIFVKNNLFYPEDKNFGEDYELWIDAMFAGIKMANLSDVLMIYTRRKNQLSKTKQAGQEEVLKTIYRKIFTNLGFEPTDDELKLHRNIDLGNFKEVSSEEEISNWFDKIVEHNTGKILDTQKFLERKSSVIKSYEDCKNRFIKLKIGRYNFCFGRKGFYKELRD